MHVRFIAATIAAAAIILTAPPLRAQDHYGPGSAQKRAFHACVYAKYISEFCKVDDWPSAAYSYSDCMVANGACKCIFAGGGDLGPETNEACRATYRSRRL